MLEWIIALISTMIGTIFGWSLQLIRPRRIVFGIIKITPLKVDKNYFRKAYFKINVFNSSDKYKAIRNLEIVFTANKGKMFNEYPIEVEFTKEGGYKDSFEKEEFEKYSNPISLISLNPYESKEILCKIEFSENDSITKAYLKYKNEKFAKRKFHIIELDMKKYH